MLGSAPPPDPSALLPYVATALAVLLGFVALLRSAASRYFAVEGPFCAEEEERYEGGAQGRPRLRSMSIGGRQEQEAPAAGSGGAGGGGGGDSQCFICGNAGTKVCAGCRSVRYCSLDCQSKHWKEEHKSKCRRKVSGSTVALIPGPVSQSRAPLKVLKKPQKILFPYDEFARLFYWDKQTFPPCGLLNCGNSCFANVVLQCLACTRPLAAYLLEGVHSRECRRNDWCFLCEIQSHIHRVKSSMQPFSPMNILSHLLSISSNLGYGRQEDAHEFMRFAIDTMQSVCLDEYGGEKALDVSTQETTLVQHIFGGYLQSQVMCTNCNQISNRYEKMMDLTVEIQGDAESLDSCLDQFTAKEWLDGENKYKCDGCNGYVKALKRLTVHQPPNILTIALKRFQSGRFGKLNKRVTFPEMLDLGPYMSTTGGNANIYSLYAIVVHLDMLNASFFGHYICYTKDFRGQWYRVDDCKVVKVDIEEVLSQGAYMLLYSRLESRLPKTIEPGEAKSSAALVTSMSSDKIGEATPIETTSEKATASGFSDEIKSNMEIDVSSVTVSSRSPDGDFPVLQSGDAEKNSPREISNSFVNLTDIPLHDNQSDELLVNLTDIPLHDNRSDKLKPLERGAESGNTSEEPTESMARSEATHCIDPSPESPVSVANGFVSEKTMAAVNAGSPSDCSSIPDSKSSATSRRIPISKEAKPLFSRGFLNKPLKRKHLLPPEKDARIEPLMHLAEVNGTSNGILESTMQIDTEKSTSELPVSSVSPQGRDGNANPSREETKDHAANGSIRYNGHLEVNLLPHFGNGSVGDPLTSFVSVDSPYRQYSQHQVENGHHVQVAVDDDDTDSDGMNRDGMNRDGMNRDGMNSDTADSNDADCDGADSNGVDLDGSDRNGTDSNGGHRGDTDSNGGHRDGADSNVGHRDGAYSNGGHRDGADSDGSINSLPIESLIDQTSADHPEGT